MQMIDIDRITNATVTTSDFTKSYTTSTGTDYIIDNYYGNIGRKEKKLTNKMKYFDIETMNIWNLLNPDYKVSIVCDFRGTSSDTCFTEEYKITMSKGLKELKRRVASTQLDWNKHDNRYTSLEFLNDMKREFDKKPCGMTSGNIYYDYSFTSSSLSLARKRNKYEIKKVICNPAKMATTVIFEDGSVEVVKKSPDDSDADIFSVVAYAVAKHIYGSNSAFKREVCKDLDFIDKEFDKVIKTASLEELTEAMKSIVKIIKKKNEGAKK